MDAIPGVEFYGMESGINFHITALDFDMDHPGINAFIKNRVELYTEYTHKCFERALKLGYISDITWNDILDYCEEGMWICVDQVFNCLKHKNIISRSGSDQELRQHMFKEPEAKSFYPPHPTAEEVIKVIREADGVACLAHPYNYQTNYVPKLVEFGLNGIEVSHANLGHYVRLAVEAADTYNLYRSGGTDHDGALSGCGGRRARPVLDGVTEEEYYILKERRLG